MIFSHHQGMLGNPRLVCTPFVPRGRRACLSNKSKFYPGIARPILPVSFLTTAHTFVSRLFFEQHILTLLWALGVFYALSTPVWNTATYNVTTRTCIKIWYQSEVLGKRCMYPIASSCYWVGSFLPNLLVAQDGANLFFDLFWRVLVNFSSHVQRRDLSWYKWPTTRGYCCSPPVTLPGRYIAVNVCCTHCPNKQPWIARYDTVNTFLNETPLRCWKFTVKTWPKLLLPRKLQIWLCIIDGSFELHYIYVHTGCSITSVRSMRLMWKQNTFLWKDPFWQKHFYN